MGPIFKLFLIYFLPKLTDQKICSSFLVLRAFVAKFSDIFQVSFLRNHNSNLCIDHNDKINVLPQLVCLSSCLCHYVTSHYVTDYILCFIQSQKLIMNHFQQKLNFLLRLIHSNQKLNIFVQVSCLFYQNMYYKHILAIVSDNCK